MVARRCQDGIPQAAGPGAGAGRCDSARRLLDRRPTGPGQGRRLLHVRPFSPKRFRVGRRDRGGIISSVPDQGRHQRDVYPSCALCRCESVPTLCRCDSVPPPRRIEKVRSLQNGKVRDQAGAARGAACPPPVVNSYGSSVLTHRGAFAQAGYEEIEHKEEL